MLRQILTCILAPAQMPPQTGWEKFSNNPENMWDEVDTKDISRACATYGASFKLDGDEMVIRRGNREFRGECSIGGLRAAEKWIQSS